MKRDIIRPFFPSFIGLALFFRIVAGPRHTRHSLQIFTEPVFINHGPCFDLSVKHSAKPKEIPLASLLGVDMGFSFLVEGIIWA